MDQHLGYKSFRRQPSTTASPKAIRTKPISALACNGSPKNVIPKPMATGGISRVTSMRLLEPARLIILKYNRWCTDVHRVENARSAAQVLFIRLKLVSPSIQSAVGIIKTLLPKSMPKAFISEDYPASGNLAQTSAKNRKDLRAKLQVVLSCKCRNCAVRLSLR